MANEEWGEAVAHAKRFGLNVDTVYIAQWLAQAPSQYSIKDFLSKIADTAWVVNECISKVCPLSTVPRAALGQRLDPRFVLLPVSDVSTGICRHSAIHQHPHASTGNYRSHIGLTGPGFALCSLLPIPELLAYPLFAAIAFRCRSRRPRPSPSNFSNTVLPLHRGGKCSLTTTLMSRTRSGLRLCRRR